MIGRHWRLVTGWRGDWRSKLITVSQILVGVVTLLGLLAMLTRQPLLLLGFAFSQGFLILGIVLFVIVALFSQRTMVLEQFGAGEVIFNQGDHGRDVYVIKSGSVEAIQTQLDGSKQTIRRMGAGDHFGEIALLGKTARTATIRAVSAVEVFKMSPTSFAALYTTLPSFREHFDKVVEARLREIGTAKK